MRVLLIVSMFLPLGGCLFIFPIPLSAFQDGNACAGETVYVGQTLKHDDGRTGTVEKVIGRHQRCQSAARPMLVEIKFLDLVPTAPASIEQRPR